MDEMKRRKSVLLADSCLQGLEGFGNESLGVIDCWLTLRAEMSFVLVLLLHGVPAAILLVSITFPCKNND